MHANQFVELLWAWIFSPSKQPRKNKESSWWFAETSKPNLHYLKRRNMFPILPQSALRPNFGRHRFTRSLARLHRSDEYSR
jgi:hypothetical protein